MLSKERKKANDFKRDLEYARQKLDYTEKEVKSLKNTDTNKIIEQ